ncbi:MAG: T9SS type A sorting domain-containing protein [Bacteroidales bacterium]|nr:T9SS type A sorting domain-containing protein [Bacteroidales bacterium]
MKRIVILGLFVALVGMVSAQYVVDDTFDQLRVKINVPDAKLAVVDGQTHVLIDGYADGGEVGRPALPVVGYMLTVPFCKGMEVSVSNVVFDTIEISNPVPVQPVRAKSDTGHYAQVIDGAFYNTDTFYALPLARVEQVGVARDRNLAQLQFSPVSINAKRGVAVVCRSAEVSVRYVDADVDSTLAVYNRYHTPAFTYGKTLNNLFPATKDASMKAPIRMAVFVRQYLNTAKLDEFIAWKKRQGMIVDKYVLEEIGKTTYSDIASFTKSLYTQSTSKNPAPTFVVLIGDKEYLPTRTSTILEESMGTHPTDLDYVLWTGGDYVPDAYIGRISVTNATELASAIDKTLMYEQYLFTDDSYLARAALVSGKDEGTTNDNAYNYCDPTMDYIAKYYVSPANGYENIYYWKNNTSFAPQGVTVTGSSLTAGIGLTVRTRYNEGIGLINYSAHGNYNQWGNPQLTVSQVASMTNEGMPSVMIGNACLTNKFDEGVCLGEALLRKNNNAGAVVYIGATNSTTWPMDFYWAVGVRSNINNTMDATFSPSRPGMYDRLFHTHNESFSTHGFTAGAMVFSGNMAMQNSSYSATYKRYYWEIYEVMGDPSLMPWLGRASDISIVCTANDNGLLTFTTAPNAYVALVSNDSLKVMGAAFASRTGVATMRATGADLSNCSVAIMSQGHKPFFQPFNNLSIDRIQTIEARVFPNPSTGRFSVELPINAEVEVFSATGVKVYGKTHTEGVAEINLEAQPLGVYIMRVNTGGQVFTRRLIKQ